MATLPGRSSYIQVNIYGKTLGGLGLEGVQLFDVLRDVGCPSLCVFEVPIVLRNEKDNSNKDEYQNLDKTSSVFYSDDDSLLFPRSSTPFDSAQDFTLCNSNLPSRINSNATEEITTSPENISSQPKSDIGLDRPYDSLESYKNVQKKIILENGTLIHETDDASVHQDIRPKPMKYMFNDFPVLTSSTSFRGFETANKFEVLQRLNISTPAEFAPLAKLATKQTRRMSERLKKRKSADQIRQRNRVSVQTKCASERLEPINRGQKKINASNTLPITTRNMERRVTVQVAHSAKKIPPTETTRSAKNLTSWPKIESPRARLRPKRHGTVLNEKNVRSILPLKRSRSADVRFELINLGQKKINASNTLPITTRNMGRRVTVQVAHSAKKIPPTETTRSAKNLTSWPKIESPRARLRPKRHGTVLNEKNVRSILPLKRSRSADVLKSETNFSCNSNKKPRRTRTSSCNDILERWDISVLPAKFSSIQPTTTQEKKNVTRSSSGKFSPLVVKRFGRRYTVQNSKSRLFLKPVVRLKSCHLLKPNYTTSCSNRRLAGPRRTRSLNKMKKLRALIRKKSLDTELLENYGNYKSTTLSTRKRLSRTTSQICQNQSSEYQLIQRKSCQPMHLAHVQISSEQVGESVHAPEINPFSSFCGSEPVYQELDAANLPVDCGDNTEACSPYHYTFYSDLYNENVSTMDCTDYGTNSFFGDVNGNMCDQMLNDGANSVDEGMETLVDVEPEVVAVQKQSVNLDEFDANETCDGSIGCDDHDDISVDNCTKLDPESQKNTQEMLNELHTVKCQFNNCKAVFKWRVKYGKLRLIDHALLHLPDFSHSCQSCDYRSPKSSLMRRHIKLYHPAEETKGYGMKDLLARPEEADAIKKLWSDCYGDNTDLLGMTFTHGKSLRVHRKERKPRKIRPNVTFKNP